MSKIRIAAVGDVMMGDQPVCFGFGIRSLYDKKGYSFLLKDETILTALRNSDLVIANFESAYDEAEEMDFNLNTVSASKNAIPFLKELGISVVSLANNHVLEQGIKELCRLQESLSRNGIIGIGTPEKPYAKIQHNEHSIAILAYTAIADYKNAANIRLWDFVLSAEEISRISRDTDYTIVLMHWGSEFISEPSPQQAMMGHSIINAGANLVLGSHPHVLQPEEKYKNGMIVYSMGNFIFDNYYKPATKSVVFVFDIDLESRDVCLSRIPILINATDFAVSRAHGENIPAMWRDCVIAGDPVATYNRKVFKQRLHYSAATALHILKNVHRYKNIGKMFLWMLRRLWLFITNFVREYRSPESVYKCH